MDAEPALRAMLDRLYTDVTSFEFPEERFERVYGEVERTLYEGTLPARVLAPLPGLRARARPRGPRRRHVARGRRPGRRAAGGRLVRRARAQRRAVRAVRARARHPHGPRRFPSPRPRIRFRRLLTALRLFKPGAVALGPLGWTRADEGAWQPFALGAAGHLRGDPWWLPRDEETDLGELGELLARSRHGGTVAWALSRFEMGCERALDTEALSDYLLGAASAARRARRHRPRQPRPAPRGALRRGGATAGRCSGEWSWRSRSSAS